MRKKQIISSDSDYFRDNEDAIKLESCPDGGNACKSQMTFMNENLLLARKFVETKEYNRALQLIKVAFDSTFSLKEEQCQCCAKLFRETIIKTLDKIVADLTKMTRGLFGYRNFKSDLSLAKQLLNDLKTL